MNESELERMVVRIAGDGSDYQKMLKDAEGATKDTAKAVEDAGKKIEGAEQSLNHFASAAANAVVALGGLALLKDALGNFQEAEDIAVRLSAALEANGRDVEALTADYSDFAATLERTTTAEDDGIIKLLQTAETMGITGEAAKRAAKNAIALEGALGIDAQSAIRMTTALEQGHAEMLGRFIPALRGIQDETEQAAKAQEILAKMFGAAEATAKTSSGAMKNLSRDFGNMLEDIGAVVATAIRPFIDALSQLVAMLRELPGWVKTAATAVIGLSVAFTVAAGTLAAFKGGMALFLGPELLKSVGVLGAMKLSVVNFGKAILASPLTPWVVAIGGAIAVFASLDAETKKTITVVAALAGTITLAVTAYLKWTTISTTVVVAVKAIAGAMKLGTIGVVGMLKSFITNPIVLFTAAVGAASYAVVKFVQSTKVVKEVNKVWNDAMTSSANTHKRFVETIQETTDDVLKSLENLSGKGMKLDFLQKQLKPTEKMLEGLKENVREAQEAVDSLTTREKAQDMAGTNPKATALRKQLEQAIESAEVMQKKFDTIGKEIQKAINPKLDPKITDGIKALNDALDLQIKTFGMSANEIENYKLKLMGATEEMLAHGRALDQTLQLKQLDREISTFGMDEEQVKLLEITEARERQNKTIADSTKQVKELADEIRSLQKMQGEQKGRTDWFGKEMKVDPEIAKRIREAEIEQRKLTDAIEETGKKQEDIDERRLKLKGLKENAKELEQFKKLMEEGKAVVESVATPVEKYNDRVKYLTKLLEGDAIGQGTFNRAVDQAKKELDDATKSTSALRQELQAIQGAVVGSAEAITRMNAFTDRMKTSQRELRDALKAGRGEGPMKLPDVKGGKMPDIKGPDVKGGGKMPDVKPPKMPDMEPVKVTGEITKLTLAADLPALKLAAEIDRLTLAADLPMLKLKAEIEALNFPEMPLLPAGLTMNNKKPGGGAPPIRDEGKNPDRPLAGENKGKTDELLTEIRDILRAKKDGGITIKPANL